MRFETSTPPDGIDWAAMAAWWDAWGAPIGILIVIVGAFIAFRVVRTIIGRVVAEHPSLVTVRTLVGSERIVDMLVGEQLPRIC